MKSSDIEMREKKRLLGSTTAVTTYRDMAAANLSLEAGGRYSSDTTIVGSAAIPKYPAASGPWAGGDAGVEPPFDVDVSYVEPTGTPAEIAASLASPVSSATLAVTPPPDGFLSPSVVRGAASPGEAITDDGCSPSGGGGATSSSTEDGVAPIRRRKFT
jgi:hypothetical protein